MLTESQIAKLLEPYLDGKVPPGGLYAQLSAYLDLLLRWNARTNLTAIREPEEIVRRHFGESLFGATQLPQQIPPGITLLDFGSGAGFPGLPIQLWLPELRVTLAESQGKKAAFLREAVRTLGLKAEVLAGRVEALPEDRRFNIVALRAVDKMEEALIEARKRVLPGGLLLALAGEGLLPGADAQVLRLPNSAESFVYLERC